MYFRRVIANKLRDLFSYAQVLWVTLCIKCYIQLLAAVFSTVLLNCTKTRQSVIYINYQLVMIF